jgi:uncharacterized membrane protein
MERLFFLCRIICCGLLVLGAFYGCDSDGGGTPPPPEPQPTFTALPFSNDMFWESWVSAMSPDGKRLAGGCRAENYEVEAVLWVEGELVDMGHMGPPEPEPRTSYATGTTDSGVVIGGEGYADLSPSAYYYENETWTQIINPNTGNYAMEATGISSDGTVIVGNTTDVIDNEGEEEQFEGGYSWDRTTGDYKLAPSSFFADICDSYADCHIFFSSVTADGKAIVGSDTYSNESSTTNGSSFVDSSCMDTSCEVLAPAAELSAEDKLIPVYYELAGHVPPVRLPLPGNYPKGVAQGISRNGSYMVGAALGNLMPTIAVYWDQNMAVHIIGSLGPDTNYHDTLAYSVTDDGSTIVGRSNGKAFIFTTTDGLMALEDYLKEIGLGDALAEWELLTATAISPDGHYIAGTGIYREHYPRGYVVYIP